MARLGGKRPVSPVKSADLKKEVLKKNRQLKDQNSSLSKDNKEAKANLSKSEKLLKKIDDQIFDRQMSLDNIDVTLMKRKSILSDKENELKEVIESLSKQMSERVSLDGDIVSRVDKVSDLKSEIQSLKSTIKSLEHEEDKFADLEDYISKAKKAASSAKSAAKKANDSCKLAKDKASKQIAAIQKEIKENQIIKHDTEMQIKEVVLEYKDISQKQNEILSKITEQIKYSDIKKKDMETAISNYKVEIEDLIELQNIKKSGIKKVRAEYDKFKLQAFDEMSRLKMKGKIENINKAGLGDVFSK